MSDARAARSMGVDRATVERYKRGHDQDGPIVSEVNAKFVLRSRKLWRPFWVCVGKLMHRELGGAR